MSPGDLVTPLAVGVLASISRAMVRVIPRPSLGIITTGGELAAAEGPLREGEIRDSNGPMLAAMARGQGIEPRQTRHATDREEAIAEALQAAADWDIVVLTGGVSVGTFDLVPQALAEYGAETIFRGVEQKPGRPLLFARRTGSCSSACPAIRWPATWAFIATFRRPLPGSAVGRRAGQRYRAS